MAKDSRIVALLIGILAGAGLVSPVLSAAPQSNGKPAAATPKVSPYAVALNRQRAQQAQDAHAPVTSPSMSVGRPPKLAHRPPRH